MSRKIGTISNGNGPARPVYDTTTRRPRNPRRLALLLGAPLALLTSCGIGASMAGGTPTPTPTPTVTTTATATPKPVEVEKQKTPKACLDALDRAETVMSEASDAMNTVAESYKAIAAGDADAFTKATQKLPDHTAVIREDRAGYDGLADKCRAAK